MEVIHECGKCHQKFNVKSNLTRHMKTHEPKSFQCEVCEKTFTLKQNLDKHAKQHLYPVIPLYKNGEARLKCSTEAADVAKRPSKTVHAVWLDPTTAETAAKKSGHELWRANLQITFGKYAGQSFKWLVENDVGWVVWLLDTYRRNGEKCPRLKWQKERLVEFVQDFSCVKVHLDNRLKVRDQILFTHPPHCHWVNSYLVYLESIALLNLFN